MFAEAILSRARRRYSTERGLSIRKIKERLGEKGLEGHGSGNGGVSCVTVKPQLAFGQVSTATVGDRSRVPLARDCIELLTRK